MHTRLVPLRACGARHATATDAGLSAGEKKEKYESSDEYKQLMADKAQIDEALANGTCSTRETS